MAAGFTVFEFEDYKKYLRIAISSRGRGEKSRVALAIRCHLTYVSQVLHGGAHLSLEQAEAMSRHLGHAPEETDFFLLLVLENRAGTQELKKHYGKKIRQALEQRSLLKSRLGHHKILPPEQTATYFSAWFYSVVHLMLSFKGGQTRESIARELGLSPRKVSEVLNFMLDTGLAQQRQGRYETGKVSIHLPSDSPMISKHHVNWRVQAIASLEREVPEELHYSSAVSIAKKDIPKIREALVAAIEKVRGIVRESPEEEIHCYSLDFFRVGARER